MPSTPPVDFQALAQGQSGTTNQDYPYSIKATDLMENYYYATPIVPATNESGRQNLLTEIEVNEGAFTQRKFQVELAAGSNVGDLLQWDGAEWISVAGGANNESLLIFRNGFWSAFSPPPSSGIYVLGSNNGVVQWLATEDCN